ncbi:MAG: hypothetical protein IPN84_12040 [Sphingomonadales bacterium]|jgi:hypothetical protein|nr:hypothetical protein [Sphingomonadales bacterium]
MISFLKRRNRSEYEGTVLGDLKAMFVNSSINWYALLGAIAIPAIIATAFIMEKMKPEYQEPEVYYITTYKANRTTAEIKAQQAKDEVIRKQAKAEEERAAAVRRAEYRKLADLFGMDVDEK